jgi:hypothetical protein
MKVNQAILIVDDDFAHRTMLKKLGLPTLLCINQTTFCS